MIKNYEEKVLEPLNPLHLKLFKKALESLNLESSNPFHKLHQLIGRKTSLQSLRVPVLFDKIDGIH